MPTPGPEQALALVERLSISGIPGATELSGLVTSSWNLARAQQAAFYPHLLVFGPLAEHAVHCARTLLDITAHPPMGSPPELPTGRWTPPGDVDVMHGAEAALRKRGMPGDHHLADLIAQLAVRARCAPVDPESHTQHMLTSVLDASREIGLAGAASRIEAEAPHGGENVS